MADQVRELTAAEHLEAAIALLAAAGLPIVLEGRWRVELFIEGGRVQKLVPLVLDDPPVRVTFGRNRLDEIRPAA